MLSFANSSTLRYNDKSVVKKLLLSTGYREPEPEVETDATGESAVQVEAK